MEINEVLTEVKKQCGRTYKSKIKLAWINGDYYKEGIQKWTQQLQTLRNSANGFNILRNHRA